MNRCTCPASVDITFIGHLPGCPENDPPDFLSRLHTLRSYAIDVKAQADAMHLGAVAVQMAGVEEAATLAIYYYNQTHNPAPANVETCRPG